MKKQILTGVISIVLAAGIPTSTVVFAQTGSSDNSAAAHAVGSTLEVHINDDGTALVRGAKVTAVSSSSITATTAWGAASLTWTVHTNSSTELVRRFGGNFTSLSEISVGNYVSFRGPLDTTASSLTVTAKVIKDWSIQRARANFSGVIQSIGTTTQSFALQTKERGLITVFVASTTVITRGGTRLTFANLKNGDEVDHTSGLFDNVARTLRADTIKLHVSKGLLNRRTFEGKMKSLAATSTPTTMMLMVGSNDFTVNIPSGISILNKRWGVASLPDFKVGNTIRVFGAVQASSTSVIDVTVVRNTSI